MTFIEMLELSSHQNCHGNSNNDKMKELTRFIKEKHRN